VRTTDGGQTWNRYSQDFADTWWGGVAFPDPRHAWVAGSNGQIVFSSDGGESWTSQESHWNLGLSHIAFADSLHGWASGWSRLLHTDDGGTTWTAQLSDSQISFEEISVLDSRQAWLAGKPGAILHTTDGGVHWVEQSLPLACPATQHIVFAGSQRGWTYGSGYCGGDFPTSAAFQTTDGGVHWVEIGAVVVPSAFGDSLNGIASDYLGLDAVTLRTTDGGQTWQEATTGYPVNSRGVAMPDAHHAWSVGYHGSILKYSDAITSAEEPVAPAIPDDYSLAAYPNPFNPSTQLIYTLPASGVIQLAVYDIQGRRVATLLDGRQERGEHTMTFDASGLASGVYFARLSGPTFSRAQKLIVLK
jgi:photosystem II stability/assembly factor-like uncharacterized protein